MRETTVLTATALHFLLSRAGALSFKALEVKFLHLLEFLLVLTTSRRTSRIVTYLVHGFDVPFRVLQELVNVLAKHLLEVAVLHSTLLGLAAASLAVHLRPAVST